MAGKRRIIRLTSTFQTRQGAVASALVAGAVATTALTVTAQAPAEAAVGAAAPITTLAEGGKAAKSLTSGRAQVVGKAQAEERAGKKAGRTAGKREKAVKADDVIKLAKTQVGISEDGSGESKFGRWYASTSYAQKTMQRDAGGGSTKVYEDAPWCSMFVTWLGDKVGTDELGADAYTVTHAKSFKSEGRWGSTPRPGAVVFFDWDGGKSIGGIDHVGLVTEVVNNGKVKTVEGNISNAVVSKTRTSGTIVGYGYPDYAK